ncbi:MAG: lipid A phosphate methyltransferase [Rhizobiaceae bacterium]|nr:lipid A phosphate methyltransferase [Rhizobiaceae bacterium]
MRLNDRLVYHGQFLFRWRSYLPLALLLIAAPVFAESARMEAWVGDEAFSAWVYFCILVSFSGQLVRCITVGYVPVGTSGRGTKEQRAECLNTTGMYSIVRNPPYLGNFLAMLGIVMSLMVWWFVLAFVLMYWLYIEWIIWVEEDFLAKRFGAAYDKWCAVTPAFIPNISLWKAADLSFSFKTVVRREYHGLLAIVSAFLCAKSILDLGVKGQDLQQWVLTDRIEIYLFAAGCILYLVALVLTKRTRLLTVSGRS